MEHIGRWIVCRWGYYKNNNNLYGNIYEKRMTWKMKRCLELQRGQEALIKKKKGESYEKNRKTIGLNTTVTI